MSSELAISADSQVAEALVESAAQKSDEQIIESANRKHMKSPEKTHRKRKSKSSVHFDKHLEHSAVGENQNATKTSHMSASNDQEEKTASFDSALNEQSIIPATTLKQRRNKPKRSSDHVPFSHSSFKRPSKSQYGNPSNHYQSHSQSFSPTNSQLRAQFVSSPQPFTPEEIAQQKARRKSWLKQTEHQLAQVHMNAQAIKTRESRMQMLGLILIWVFVIAIMFWFVFRSMNQMPNRPSIRRVPNQSVNPDFNHSKWWT